MRPFKRKFPKWFVSIALFWLLVIVMSIVVSAEETSDYENFALSVTSDGIVNITKDTSGWIVKLYGKTESGCNGDTTSAVTATLVITNKATKDDSTMRAVDFKLTTTGCNSNVSSQPYTLDSTTTSVSFTATSGTGASNANTVTISFADIALESLGNSVSTTFLTSFGGSYSVDGTNITESAMLTKLDSESYTLVATPNAGYEVYGWASSKGMLNTSGATTYTYSGKSEMSVWPVFMKSGSAVYYIKDTSPVLYYTFFDEALAAAGSSGTIVLEQSGYLYGTAESSFTLSGQTLLLPYSATELSISTSTYTDESGSLKSTWIYANNTFTSDQYDDGNASNSSVGGVLEPNTNVYLNLTIPSGTILNVNSGSKLVIGGTIVSGTNNTGGICGATAGAHSNLTVDGTLNVNSGGVLSACGYVLGTGNVNVVGGSAYQPFVMMDYHDGHHTANSTKNANFPLYRYSIQNIRPTLTMSQNGKMHGYVDIYTQSTNVYITTIQARHNVACVGLIGDSDDEALIQLASSSATVEATYDASDYVTITSGVTGNQYYSKAGKTKLTINGGATLGNLSISVNVPIVGAQTSSSSAVDFPVPYYYDITLENGTYTLPYTLVLYPGASMYIAESANLVVSGGEFVALDGLRDYTSRNTSITIGSWYEYHYPSTSNFQNNHSKGTYNGTANLIVDGTLTVNSGAGFGGYVQTNGTGKVVMNGTPSATIGVGNVTTYGTPVNEYVGRTEHTLNAWLWETDGDLIEMTTGTTYYGVDKGTHTIANYDYIVYTSPNQSEANATVVNDEALNADIKGSWCTAEGHSITNVVTAPTCTEKGYTTHTCDACGYSYKDTEVEATGHTEVTDTAVAPTCTATGLTEGKHCSVCDAVIVAQTEVAALGHTEVTDAAVEATCTETGLTAGSHCETCGEVIAAQEEIPSLGHSYSTSVNTETLKVTYTCSGCGDEYTTDGIILQVLDCSYDSEILLRMKFVISDAMLSSDATITMTKYGRETETVTYTMAQLKANGMDASGRYVTQIGVASGEMTSKVVTEVKDGDGNVITMVNKDYKVRGTSIDYSVKKYVEAVLASTLPDENKAAAKALIVYGGYAQQYFDVDKENPAYNLDGVDSSLGEVSLSDDYEATADGSLTGIDIESYELHLDSYIFMRVRFEVTGETDISGYTVNLKGSGTGANGVALQLKQESDGIYYVDTIGIPAAWLDSVYTVTVTNGTETMTLNLSALSWVKDIVVDTNVNTEQVNMAKALYFYNQACNTLFGK